MYEVIGECIKSATAIKLGEIFGTSIKRYKENITNLQYPHFFIYQVSLNIAPDTKNKWNLNYLMNIRYRYVADVSTVNDLEQELDRVGLQLLAEFDSIMLERLVRVTNCRYEKADGVLQFFFNVNVRVTKPVQETIKMNELELKEEVN